MTPSRAAIFQPLITLSTVDAVASAAGTTVEHLEQIVNARERLYTPLSVRRRRGRSPRVVYSVAEAVTGVHWKIALWIRDSWSPPAYVHGFVKKRSIVTNARHHLNRDLVVTADVADFFASITTKQVVDALERLGAPREVATLLAEISTFRGVLPAGTRCSPAIANIVCDSLDAELARTFPNYTRYADDLSFSGAEAEVPRKDALEKVLERQGFKLREDSFHTVPRKRSQYVTGLLVNHPHGPHVPRRLKRRLAINVRCIVKYGITEHCERLGVDEGVHVAWLRGALNQVASVERDFAQRLRSQLENALAPAPPPADDDDEFWSVVD